jgi:hypothetical protein
MRSEDQLLANKSTRRSRGLLFDNNNWSSDLIYGCFRSLAKNISHYILALSGVQDNKSTIIHHPPLHILYAYNYARKYDTSVKGISSKKQHFNFLKADFVAINKKLSDIDWSFLKPISDIDVMMEAFYSKLNDIFSICVPRSLRFYKSKYPPWFNSSIVKQLRQKQKLWLKYKQSKSPLFYDEFKSIRKIIKLEIKRAHCKYILQVEQNITKDPKSFWSYIDCIKKNNFIPTYMTFNDKELQTPTDIANGFADFFQQTYTSSSTAVSDNNHFDMYSRNSG